MKDPSRREKLNRPKARPKANQPKRAKPASFAFPSYRTLRGWAIGTLLETHAIIECPKHGHIRDRGSWAHGWEDARQVAKSHPFAGATARACVKAIDEVMTSIGNVCPEC